MTDTPKALQDMTPEEAAPIMEAWRDGKSLARLYPSGWEFGGSGHLLDREGIYRLPPEPEHTPIDVPWEWMPDWIQRVTMDETERFWAWEKDPILGRHFWHCSNGKCDRITIIKLDPTGIIWDRSLTKRPKG